MRSNWRRNTPYHALRLPREPLLTSLALDRGQPSRKVAEAVIFRSLGIRIRRKMAAYGIKSTDWLFGLHQSAKISEQYFFGVLRRLKENCGTEFYFHPTAGIDGHPTEQEVKLLVNPDLPEFLRSHKISLGSNRDLVEVTGTDNSGSAQGTQYSRSFE